jgi:hypothetical protein
METLKNREKRDYTEEEIRLGQTNKNQLATLFNK